MSPADVPDIVAALDARTASRIKSWPRNTNRASDAGHPCVRYLVLCRTANDKRELHDVGLQRIFDEGNLHEAAMMRDLADAGIRVVEQQRAYEWKKFELTGSIDGKIAAGGGAYIPIEIKSCSPNVFPSLRDLAPADMVKSKYPWIRKYPAQVLLYMLMEGAESGIMVFKNKANGEKIQKVFNLDGPTLEYAESILTKLEDVNGHVHAGTVPDAAQIDDCKGCPFAKTACFPGHDYGPGFEIMSDAEAEAKLARWESLRASAQEFAEIDADIKESFRGRTAIVGFFKIESRAYETTSYAIPKDIKAQYAEKKQAFRTSIERI
jgi:hypothetical protein